MIFPWTTVDSVLDKFNQAVEDLDILAENAQQKSVNAEKRAQFWHEKSAVFLNIRDRARRISGKINDLIQ